MTAPKSIPVYRPALAGTEGAALERVLKSRWLTQGPEVAAFETEFAAYTGARFACATSNCTTALHLALLAAGAGPGDEVITASHSFVATANVIRHCGAQPVFADVLPGTFNLDPVRVAEALGPKTRAILAVHQIGMPCDLGAILKIAKARGIPVVEDAACAVGSEIDLGKGFEPVGKPHGVLACFSFHPRKLLTCGEGGMITSNDEAMIERLRRLRQHGMGVSDTARHRSSEVVFEVYDEVGYNYRMSDLHAAVGREQLKLLPAVLTRRREQAAKYLRELAEAKGLGLPESPSWARTNWQSFCIRLPLALEQKSFMQRALDEGISLRRGIQCAHREPAYPPGSWRGTRLDESERAQDHCVLLPLYHELGGEEQDRVIEFVRKECAGVR